MPNRIMKESIHVSEKIALLSDFQFRLWVSLITYVDDYGRGDARPPIIKGAAFPLREAVTGCDIERGLIKLAEADCIRLYEVEGRPYLCFPNWEAHQRIQTKRSKFPAPVSTVDDGGIPPESESKSKSLSESVFCAKGDFAPQADKKEEVLFSLPLNGGGEYPLDKRRVNEWAALYPAVDILSQLRAMKGWLAANPKRQKTLSGINRFINSWLAREQDRGGKNPRGGRDDAAALDKFMEWNDAELFAEPKPAKEEGI